jgi:hypothetical protein
VISLSKNRLAQLGPLGRTLVIALVILIALTIVLPLATSIYGTGGAIAAACAAAVMGLASIAAELACLPFHRPTDVLWASLLGMGVRMAIPLAACMLVYFQRGSLADAGFVYWVMAIYLVVLPAETALSVARAGATLPNTKL